MNKVRKIMMIASVLVIGSMAFMTGASALTFPGPWETEEVGGATVPVALQYGDFYSYSLPLLQYFYDGDTQLNTGDYYYVASSPGLLDDEIMIGTGANGHYDNTDVLGSDDIADDAFPTPKPGGSSYFRTGDSSDSPDPINGPTLGDAPDSWDITLTGLINYLDDSALVFYFNNNQRGSGTDINLNAWGQVRIVDVDGNPKLDTILFDFTNAFTGNDVTAYDSQGTPTSTYPSEASDPLKWPNAGDFALSGGMLCLDVDGDSGGGLISCDLADNDDVELEHNLGANKAAYAIYSPEIDAMLETWVANGYDVLQCDFRMTDLNNGYEQIFILANADIPVIPEPATLFLLGSGLLGLVGVGFRKKS